MKLHDSLRSLNKRFAYVTPRDYMDFLRHFEELYTTKRAEWAEQQRHLNLGLEKLHQTGQQVAEMKVHKGIARCRDCCSFVDPVVE